MSKALTLTQPWASLVVAGVKRIETRGWRTNYRGPLVIHSAAGWSTDVRWFARELYERGILPVRPDQLPIGCLVGRVQLVDVVATENIVLPETSLERMLGDYTPGRFGWFLEHPEPIYPPRPWKGALSLWELAPEALL